METKLQTLKKLTTKDLVRVIGGSAGGGDGAEPVKASRVAYVKPEDVYKP
ncbi:hypothetical protein HG263_21710 [Pseudoalteromonas sp. JBTF-M23]|uniref:Uncharacterized protein n=1 Tax=Pseudoalteromonas caenipelagi TaxID=2726988 RepID=A0A849VNA2_9GAMM|nr:hypothetical protein [Pseudoalteromonas caenipelagi]NOU53121.1 hypothetical protein [Pseudoalteromonas caenipelagi]